MASTTPTPILLLRSAVGKTYTDLELRRILEHVGDVDLAFEALKMRPRPAWVHDVATNRKTR